MEFIGIILGLLLLSFGANVMVVGVVSLAKRFQVSKLLISSVIIGLGTSFPELFVSIKANIAHSPEIVMGNIIGSNIANIFLVVGFAALIYPVLSSERAVKRETLVMLFASILLVILIYFSAITRLIAFFMLLFLALYLVYSIREDKKQSRQSRERNIEGTELETDGSFFQTDQLFFNVVYSIGGLALLLFGADLLVENAIDIARAFGLSEAVIGLSLIAIGTSLPELATAIAASLKKHSEVVLGNVIGSCVMNILFILGVTGLIIPITISPVFLSVDVWVMLLSAALLSFFILSHKPINRFFGLGFLLIYALYSAYLYGVFSF